MKTNTGSRSLALIALACGMAGCSKPEPPATPPEAAPPAAGAITAGTYEVCDLAASEHGDVKGDHLKDMKVEIRPLNPKEATVVCIGADGCPDDVADPGYDGTVLWMIGDEKLLRTVHAFEHHPADDTPGKSSIPHLVQILKDPSDTPPETCKKANVLLLRICHPAAMPRPNAQWECTPSPGPHGADAHIEN